MNKHAAEGANRKEQSPVLSLKTVLVLHNKTGVLDKSVKPVYAQPTVYDAAASGSCIFALDVTLTTTRYLTPWRGE